MMRIKLVVAPLLLVLGPTGCGQSEKCEAFAEHLADVLIAEKGGEASPEQREKMIKKTIEECTAAPPKAEHLECAMQAGSTVAMKACEAAAS
jgi:hypothetical protein